MDKSYLDMVRILIYWQGVSGMAISEAVLEPQQWKIVIPITCQLPEANTHSLRLKQNYRHLAKDYYPLSIR